MGNDASSLEGIGSTPEKALLRLKQQLPVHRYSLVRKNDVVYWETTKGFYETNLIVKDEHGDYIKGRDKQVRGSLWGCILQSMVWFITFRIQLSPYTLNKFYYSSLLFTSFGLLFPLCFLCLILVPLLLFVICRNLNMIIHIVITKVFLIHQI